MTVPFRFGFVARPSALGAVASLLLVAGCSAPPGAVTDDDGVPDFGAYQPPATGVAGAAGVATGTPNTNTPVQNPSPAATGSGGAGSEQTANGGIGLDPAPAGNQNGSQNQGAAGSSMVGTDPSTGAGGAGFDPGENAGAGGAGFDPGASAGGSASMPPPSDGNAQPPPEPAPEQPPAPEPPPAPEQPPAPVAPAPSGDCNGAFFCDGFESVAAGASPTPAVWRVVDGFNVTDASATVTVSAANARTGAQSLRIDDETGGRTGVLATLPQSSYFVRAFFQLDATPIGTVFIGGGTSENNETRFRTQGQGSYATINSVGSVGDPVRPADANSGNGCPDCFPLVANEWFCAELAIDNGASTATLFIDGVEVAVAGPDAFATQPAQPLLFLGSWGLQGGATGVFIDDVAVGPERFGCN